MYKYFPNYFFIRKANIMEKISSAKLAEILGCTYTGKPVEITEISTDSRKISPQTLFIAFFTCTL